MNTVKILTLASLMLGLVAAPALLVGGTDLVIGKAQAQGYTNGYYRGPRDGQCYNNKRGC
jgi:peptidoglycan hydrolase-like protein with peptidoglycan-binding domain